MRTRTLVFLFATAALAAKLYCAATTIGTSDVVIFNVFARSIHDQGLLVSHGMPWRQGFTVHSIASQWAGWLLLPWLTLVAFLTWEIHTAPRPKSA